MRYTLSQAEAFYWVAKLGSFRAAAAHLNLTQPTISLRVRELEKNLDAELLDRSGYRPVMTPLGTSIYADTQRLLAIAKQIEAGAHSSPEAEREVRIGAAETFASLILPDLLSALEMRYPSWRINVSVDLSTRLETALLNHTLDIAFLAQPRVHDQTSIVPLWDVKNVWAVGNDCPFKGELATPAALVDIPIYITAPPSGLYTTMLTWFGSQGLKPQRIIACDTIALIAQLASARGGATLMPFAMVSGHGKEHALRILKCDPPVLSHNICAMWCENRAQGEWTYMADLARQLTARLASFSDA